MANRLQNIALSTDREIYAVAQPDKYFSIALIEELFLRHLPKFPTDGIAKVLFQVHSAPCPDHASDRLLDVLETHRRFAPSDL